ncbi:MAG TPA: ABC transporter ATP-binding protein [Anaerolineaceae bacterium]|jgi:branched-chain amino acid transport system ATP-binding protein|nr:ABC transporter ATP-binding protein [Anaerolineaceae bacterium]
MPLLEVKDLSVSYGAIEAVRGVSFHVNQGEILALIGANGAGKTTILRTISGLEKAKSGSILLDGVELTKLPAHKHVELGIAHVPEGRRVFSKLTVYENLMLGAKTVKDRTIVNPTLERVFDLFPRLKEREQQLAGTLSGGEQQMLAVGRGLMTNAKIMLLDEPSMGLAPIIVEDIFRIIKQINETGTSILLIEQNAYMALNVASRAYLLETGNIILSGNSKDLMVNEQVKAAYLGA